MCAYTSKILFFLQIYQPCCLEQQPQQMQQPNIKTSWAHTHPLTPSPPPPPPSSLWAIHCLYRQTLHRQQETHFLSICLLTYFLFLSPLFASTSNMSGWWGDLGLNCKHLLPPLPSNIQDLVSIPAMLWVPCPSNAHSIPRVSTSKKSAAESWDGVCCWPNRSPSNK